ncbi:EAL domain-containing protein [uncultured Alsobacter sp.]|uniref:EAL domain-containing protein n=1 Tax=uncultured Alsobacter sp. TaxID=1748258 RepID=UPI0025DDDDAC|nr:EAL domain-containing protein [uncultured Alsobacter sp.]
MRDAPPSSPDNGAPSRAHARPTARSIVRAVALWSLTALIVASTVNGAVAWLGGWNAFNYALYDARFDLSTRAATGEIIMVDIDERSIGAVGVWPWPRTIHATIVDRLTEAGAAAIAFDIDFSSASVEANDAALEDALARAGGGVILAAERQRLSAASPEISFIAPLPRFDRHSWAALVDVTLENGVVRWVPYAGAFGREMIPSLTAVLAGRASPPDGRVAIDYTIDPSTIDRISAIDLIEGRVPKRRIEGRKIIVGASAVSLKDYFVVPRYGSIPGALVQALAVDTLLQGRAIQHVDPRWIIAGVMAITLLGVLLVPRVHLALFLLFLVATSAGTELAAALIHDRKSIAFDTGGWHLALMTLALLAVAREITRRRVLWRHARSERRRAQAILDRVFRDSAGGIVVADAAGRIRAVNPAALALSDRDPTATAIGAHVSDVLPAALATLLLPSLDETATAARERTGTAVAMGRAAAERVFDYALSTFEVPGSTDEEPGWSATCLTFNDVTERVRSQQRVEHLARYDQLTGLPNRNQFIEALARPGALLGATLALVDVDNFKVVNDTMGHAAGDIVLWALADRLTRTAGKDCLVARLDGDEFAVLGRVDEKDLARRLLEAFEHPIDASGRRFALTASIGTASFVDTVSADEATRQATLALTEAKASGAERARHYDAELDARERERATLEKELAEALRQGQFMLHYQPQVASDGRALMGAEALLRWHHPERGLVSPALFVPVLESTGLIVDVGAWVLRQACRDATSWPEHLRVAVNVSVPQIAGGDLAQLVAAVLAETGLAPSRLDLELTESLFAHDIGSLRDELSAIRALGVGLALDDFGTGYSSLGYLRRFPFTKVKLDRTFVTELPHDRQSVAIVQAVVAMSASLDLSVVAEGVETAEQFDAVRLLGCNQVQGYLTGRPDTATALVRRGTAPPAAQAVA